jgi:hypothetical protein
MTLFSIIASPFHPNFADLYGRLNIECENFTSPREVIRRLKVRRPDILVGDFVYGYGNDYAGVTISNLDVVLYSLQKDAPEVRVIVLVDGEERGYVDALNSIIPLHAVLTYPVTEQAMAAVLGQ